MYDVFQEAPGVFVFVVVIVVAVAVVLCFCCLVHHAHPITTSTSRPTQAAPSLSALASRCPQTT